MSGFIKRITNMFSSEPFPEGVIKVDPPFPWPPLPKPVSETPPAPLPPLVGWTNETQKSVYEWCMAMFPRGGTPYGFAVSIVEEAIELGLAAGITEDAIAELVIAVLNKCRNQVLMQDSDREEVADVIICLMAYAGTKSYSLQAELDKKMSFNRSRPAEYYGANFEKKKRKGLVFTPEPLAQE